MARHRHWRIETVGLQFRNRGSEDGCILYVAAGVLTSVGALCFASRLSTVGGDVGAGWEVTALTAAVVGGIRLGGGNGSTTKAIVGTLIVLAITNGLVSLAVPGGVNRMVLAAILDSRRMRRHQVDQKSPAYHQQGLCKPFLPPPTEGARHKLGGSDGLRD